jgi:hypothetical protein
MRIKLACSSAAAVLAAALALMAVTATATAAPSRAQAVTTPITAAQSNGALSGVFRLTRFSVDNARQLVAHGRFTGTVTDAAGNVTSVTNTPVRSVVSNAAAAAAGPRCQILNLVLGPLHLNLLGLVVDLNEVHLDLSAVPGPGNLLGNLLCAVTHLLDNTNASTTALQNIVARLNAILAGL